MKISKKSCVAASPFHPLFILPLAWSWWLCVLEAGAMQPICWAVFSRGGVSYKIWPNGSFSKMIPCMDSFFRGGVLLHVVKKPSPCPCKLFEIIKLCLQRVSSRDEVFWRNPPGICPQEVLLKEAVLRNSPKKHGIGIQIANYLNCLIFVIKLGRGWGGVSYKKWSKPTFW